MTREARKILLPSLEITEVALPSDKNAIHVTLLERGITHDYYVRKKHENAERIDGKPQWMESRFNLFPVVLDGDGVPWAEANVYILGRIESENEPSMSSYASIADSLAAFRRFLDETGIDWTDFPSHKLKRPTYRYRAHLTLKIESGTLKASTAKRHMSAVICFYSWLIQEGSLTPAHSPWKKTDSFIQVKDAVGFQFSKRVTSSDLSIKANKSKDPYDALIEDGGRLRPLSRQEQEWLVEALIELDNIEMLLIHLLGMLSGARIQTILTLKIKHFEQNPGQDHREVRIPAGPGTGIDTKNNKRIVLHFPRWLYEKLQIYSRSERAQVRRSRSECQNGKEEYLFLSIRGSPLYANKSESLRFNEFNSKRHPKNGQAVRQFIKDRVIPHIQSKNHHNFQYRFHDLRASYGMNLTDDQLERVKSGDITLHQAREFVKVRMGHASSSTTDRYLQYRQNLEIASEINVAYHEHLRKIMDNY